MKTSIADKNFSLFIRLRDADLNGDIICVTCNKYVFWKRSDCGHFIKRQHQGTRFNEINCAAQCKACNYFEQGRTKEHGEFILKTYGQDNYNYLKSLEKKSVKRSSFDLKVLADYYKQKAIEIAKEKGIII